MNEVYAGYVTTAMRYAAPQVQKLGYDAHAFLGELTHQLQSMVANPGAEGVKSLGAHDVGRMEAGLGQFSSPAAGAVLATQEVHARG
jgi:hypothetical protein